MKSINKPILITGSHRSGTTWVGKVLARAPKVAYVFEPFNNAIDTSVNPKQFPNVYQYLCPENGNVYKSALDDLMDFKYPLKRNLMNLNSIENLARIARDQLLFFSYAHRGCRPLLKDPIAFFSAAWLAETYGMQVLVMIRHPAAFCSSLKFKNWTFNFNNFLNQPLLMEQYLHPYRTEIEHFSKHSMGVIDQGVLLWNCIHHTIRRYQEKYPKWLFVRHEDISMNPVDGFRNIFKTLELDFTDNVIAFIKFTSSDSNPVEQQPNNQFIRNSKLNVKNWTNRLKVDEIAYIKEKTEDVSHIFYTEQDWQR